MATTLGGLFDSLADAGRARALLLREGVQSGSVHLTNNESMSARSGTSAGSDSGSSDDRGFFSRLFGLGESDETVGTYSEAVRSGAAMLTVTLPDGADTRRIEALLARCGADDMDETTEVRDGRASMRGTTTTDRPLAGTGDTLKVVQEELQVGKRQVEGGGVRVRQFVTKRPVQEQVQLCEERAIVERRPVDRVLQPGELEAMDLGDREFELRERAEMPVVAKQTRVVEEVQVGKESRVRTEMIQDTVRRQDVDVEQLTAAQQNS